MNIQLHLPDLFTSFHYIHFNPPTSPSLAQMEFARKQLPGKLSRSSKHTNPRLFCLFSDVIAKLHLHCLKHSNVSFPQEHATIILILYKNHVDTLIVSSSSINFVSLSHPMNAENWKASTQRKYTTNIRRFMSCWQDVS